MFGFIKRTLKRIYSAITSQLASLFALHNVDESTLEKLERILIEADAGIEVTRPLITTLKDEMARGVLKDGAALRTSLHDKLLALLTKKTFDQHNARVFILVGINGSGKTTAAGKLAHNFAAQGKRVLLAAADTFRAAAGPQLEEWAKRTGASIQPGTEGQDPASVVFQACARFKQENFDILIVDTAGRLQTKTNLMKELEKIGTVIKRHLPDESIATLLTIDSMLGQNSLDQAKLFNESTALNGIILTKLDGTGKGGIIFAIASTLAIPVAFITYGEQLDAIKPFNPSDYVNDLLSE
ncbi:TPA: signal recognition particle-docking protein FtsY [Candidatus Dependentiae bacterium]|nr:MAG: Signal recognition particle receptor FtsY [candidate division TM6 bacterium GW2011_GWF2_43_87]HBL98373.1 signal recognition particle-docking protein FtsY [Candidatus Dependentiae bacterium]